jgi:excisionase family DNA binding protein
MSRGKILGEAGRLTLTVEEAAHLLGISRGLAYELARCGKLPVVRLGRRMLIPRAALEKMLSQQKQV